MISWLLTSFYANVLDYSGLHTCNSQCFAFFIWGLGFWSQGFMYGFGVWSVVACFAGIP